MKKEEPVDDVFEYIQPTSTAGQIIPPADGAFFVPDDKATDDDRGVNEEDLVKDDGELVNPGSSPEFDHSLRDHKSSTNPRA